MIKTLIISLLLSLTGAAPFSLVSHNHSARIVVGRGEPECVVLAAEDLASDVKAITGRELRVIRSDKARKGDVSIRTRENQEIWEAYDVVVEKGILDISGTDARGTMFGVYDFIEQYLGVDPLSFWNDTPYPRRQELSWEDVSIHQGTPSVKFRGWFINDEDLLTEWKEPGGTRRMDYPYYGHVVNRGVMERIIGALVRCRYNLIIPASFLNIFNSDEAAIADICSKRGVFLSMHHVEPMGVSGFTFQNYWKERGQEPGAFSFFSNREKVEEVWKESAIRWSKYPNVIWQLGLRGIADKPTWAADANVPEDDRGRGKLISDAIARQVEILDEAGIPKEKRFMSTTLWMEGASLNEAGWLTFPEGTIVVFADNGPGWKWARDFYTVPRNPNQRYGVYYHHAIIADGPHLASLIPASKTYRMMSEARERNSAEYAIFNVANIREFTYNISATGQMLWNMDAFSPEKWTDEWIERHYSIDQKAWARAYSIYYSALQLHPVAQIPMYLDGYLQKRCRYELDCLEKELSGQAPPEGIDDSVARNYFLVRDAGLEDKTRAAFLEDEAQNYSALCAQKASYELAMLLSSALYERLPANEKPFAYATLVYPATLMYHFTAATACLTLSRQYLSASDKVSSKEQLQKAIEEFKSIQKAADVYCSGKWENWYRDCRKINLNAISERIKNNLMRIQSL